MVLQQGDVHLYQTVDDGDISVVDGVVEMVGGLQVMAYLCLFGGNAADDRSQDSNRSWWYNLNISDPSLQYRAETQFLLRSIPATSANLIRIQDAAARDLAIFTEQGIASSVDVTASIPAPNRISIVVNIDAEGDESRFEYVENWKADA